MTALMMALGRGGVLRVTRERRRRRVDARALECNWEERVVRDTCALGRRCGRPFSALTLI